MSRKGENIYKRKDNRWEARYIKGYLTDGTAKYGYCYARTYCEVKQKLIKAKSAILNGRDVLTVSYKQRFEFYCDEWLQMNRTRIKESTYAKYYSMIEKYIKPKLGKCLLRSLNSVTIERFSYVLLYEEELSPKTVKDILTMLHSIIKYVLKSSPEIFPMMEIVYPKVPKSETRVLTREEQTRFVEYLLDEIDECKFGVLLALFTGLRIGEVCALRWENISLTEKTIKVDSTMQRLKNLGENVSNKTKVIISDPKSEASKRIIPLSNYIIELCKTQLCTDPKAFVLTGETNRYIEPRLMQYRLEHYANDCGIKGVHFHTLRHTFATRCVEVDFEIKSLSEILGHSSPKITLERYVHSSMELKRDNINKLAMIGY